MESIPGATYLGGPAWQVKTEGPSHEAVMAVVLAFRQLYIKTNKASAARVMNILSLSGQRSETAAGKEVIAFIRALKRDMKKRLAHDPYGVFLEETGPGESTERTPDEIVAIWLNGEYFHDDRDLADQLDPPGHMSYEMMQMSLQMTIRDFIRLLGCARPTGHAGPFGAPRDEVVTPRAASTNMHRRSTSLERDQRRADTIRTHWLDQKRSWSVVALAFEQAHLRGVVVLG